jgi:hypothetical protein
LIAEPQLGEEYTFPGILQHSIHLTAAKTLLAKGLAKILLKEMRRMW